jgi:hypothetical protein
MRLPAFAVFLLLLPGLAWANDWDALDQPGAFAIMRHALAPGTGDPSASRWATVQPSETSTNADASRPAGLAKPSASAGSSFRRCCQASGAGRVKPQNCWTWALSATPLPSTRFFQDFSTRDRQTRETMDLIRSTEGRLMLVTHQVNISALAGRGTRSGEVLIIREKDDGIEILGSILIDP